MVPDHGMGAAGGGQHKGWPHRLPGTASSWPSLEKRRTWRRPSAGHHPPKPPVCTWLTDDPVGAVGRQSGTVWRAFACKSQLGISRVLRSPPYLVNLHKQCCKHRSKQVTFSDTPGACQQVELPASPSTPLCASLPCGSGRPRACDHAGFVTWLVSLQALVTCDGLSPRVKQAVDGA